MKKIFAILLALVMSLSLFACGDDKEGGETDGSGTTAEAVTDAPVEPDVPVAEDFAWELVDVAVNFQTNAVSPKILIVSGNGRMPDFNEDENNYLSRPWEEYADNIVYVYVKDGLASVSDHAFMLCRNLRAITFENAQYKEGKNTCDVTSIGKCAFYGCYKLGYIDVRAPKADTVDENGTPVPAVIGAEDIPASELITGKFELPSSIKSIGEYAFRACTVMTSLTIPESVSYTGEYAFRGCTSLTEVVMKCKIKNVSEGLFYDCTALKAISRNASKVEGEALPVTVNLPESVTTIGMSAFFGCTSVTAVSFPAGLTVVGDYAFCKATALTSISLPSKVKTVGKGAFFGCTALTTLSIPSSVTTVGNNILRECTDGVSIKFAGTTDKWNSVSKSESGLETVNVVCSNGNVTWKATPKETEPQSTETVAEANT